MVIKKLLLTFSFIALVTIAFGTTTYAAQEGEQIVVSEELRKLNDLYKEGVITEEEFSKAKSILLNPDTDISAKKKKKKKKKKKLTAAERKRLNEAEIARLEEEKKMLRDEKRALKKAEKEEKVRLLEEKRKACSENPDSEACKTTIVQSLKNLKTTIGSGLSDIGKLEKEKAKKKRELEKQVAKEKREQALAEKKMERQANLEKREKIKAEKKKLKAEYKKACADDPESKKCKEGKPTEKIKNVLKKIKKLGG